MPSNVYNANWFAGNLVRKYPIDSMASCIDDNGNYLFDDIITDINISYPRSLGEYCHIASVTVTKGLVSVLIYCGSIPVAACCVSRPTYIDRYYTLDPLYDGVAGVIALGLDSVDVLGSWRFSNESDSRIVPTCCTVYDPPAVLSLGRLDDATPMTGDILLTSGNDIELSTRMITVPSDDPAKVKEIKAVFIGLPLESEKLKKYITPCEKATEVDTCNRKYISGFGGASPTCDGNIDIVSRTGTIRIDSLTDGVLVLSTDIKVSDMCPELHQHKFGEVDESDSESESDKDSWDTCPFPGPNSPDICPSEQNLSKKIVNSKMSPLIVRSKSLDLTLNYVNLYTSDVSIESGGAVYGDGTGCINVENEDLVLKTVIRDTNKVDVQLVTTVIPSSYAKIECGDAVFEANNKDISINSSDVPFKFEEYSRYHIIFTPTYIAILDGDYTELYKKECDNTLNYEISSEAVHVDESDSFSGTDFVKKIELFVTINGIKCETIAYE